MLDTKGSCRSIVYVAAGALELRGGDTDNDDDVDNDDVTLFLSQFGTTANPNSAVCPWTGTQNADFSLNAAIMSEDYV